MALLEVDRVYKSFGATEVLRGISLSVDRGEVLCILGPSGAGKSTLLRCINHLETIDGGIVRVDGGLVGYRVARDGSLRPEKENVAARDRAKIGMVFQRFNLFGHETALENVMEAPIHVRRIPRDEARRRGVALLEKVGLQDKLNAYPRQLSGGQQQRVAIARALAMDPTLMLFDEPTSALDATLVGEVLQTMKQLAAEGMTMVVVTHELDFARHVADSVAVMDEGVIVEQEPPAILFASPKHARTRSLLASVLPPGGEDGQGGSPAEGRPRAVRG